MNLIDRMITRVQRPISPVAPLLAQLYVSRASVSANDDLSSISAIEPRSEDHPNLTGNQPNAIRLLAHDASIPTSFGQPGKQQQANVFRRGSDSVISEASAPALPLPAIEPSAPAQFYERDSSLTQLHGPVMSRTTKHGQNIDEKEASELASTGLLTPSAQSKRARRAERIVDQNNFHDQLRPAPTTEVNISIGHIEVRATQRAEPARRSASPSHVTLDDFLRRRPEASR